MLRNVIDITFLLDYLTENKKKKKVKTQVSLKVCLTLVLTFYIFGTELAFSLDFLTFKNFSKIQVYKKYLTKS